MKGSFGELTFGLAGLALSLWGVGLLAVSLLSVRERYGEIGLRMAVGAQPRDILPIPCRVCLTCAAWWHYRRCYWRWVYPHWQQNHRMGYGSNLGGGYLSVLDIPLYFDSFRGLSSASGPNRFAEE